MSSLLVPYLAPLAGSLVSPDTAAPIDLLVRQRYADRCSMFVRRAPRGLG
jgi:hypothetical protein